MFADDEKDIPRVFRVEERRAEMARMMVAGSPFWVRRFKASM